MVGGDEYALKNSFCCSNLIRTHHHQFTLCGKYAIAREDIEQGMFGKEGCREIVQIANNLILSVCPVRSKLKGIAAFGRFLNLLVTCFVGTLTVLHLRFVTCSVGIVFRVRTIGDDEQLNVFKQTTISPE